MLLSYNQIYITIEVNYNISIEVIKITILNKLSI